MIPQRNPRKVRLAGRNFAKATQARMCFFVLCRYRICHHDQVGPFVSFCTTSRARAFPNENYTQFFPQGKLNAYERSLNPAVGSSNALGLSYCGQPLFSPEYISDFGSDSTNGGICRNCVEMAKLTAESDTKRDLQYSEESIEGSIDNLASSEGNTYGEPEANKLKVDSSFQHKKRWGHQRAPLKTLYNPSFQIYPASSALENRHILLPPQPSFRHPLFQNQQPLQQTVPTTRQQISSVVQPYPRPTTPVTASSQDLEHPTSLSTILHRILYNYPLRTRIAIEKAVANQTPEKRAQTLQTLQAGFEERLRQRYIEQSPESIKRE